VAKSASENLMDKSDGENAPFELKLTAERKAESAAEPLNREGDPGYTVFTHPARSALQRWKG
jgi:hypothetical protein